jgi:hypothetical protein
MARGRCRSTAGRGLRHTSLERRAGFSTPLKRARPEREWRAALYQDQRVCPGCDIEFDLDVLIDEIVVAR